MTERREYAIVRFLEQGSLCYKIDDVTEGRNLLQYIKAEERIEKKKLFVWFISLAEQLELYHRNMKQGYGHVNPYAVIINEEGKSVLLDIEAKENNELLKRMQKKNFRSLFVKKDNDFGEQVKPEDDVFGFGKLLLFMMEKGKVETEFTGLEKIRLKKIIEKCTSVEGDAEKTFKNVQKELYKMGKGCRVKRDFGIRMIVVGTVVTAGIGVSAILNSQDAKKEQENVSTETESSAFEEEERLFLELGLLYYTELGDCASSREMLNNIKDYSKAADIYLQFFDYIQKGNILEEGQWNRLWQELKEEWERLGVENKLWYKGPVLEACKLRNTAESWKIICEIGEEAKENRVWNGIADDPEKEAMISQYLAEAYEIVGEEEKSLSEYESWKMMETNPEDLEQIFLKILTLSERIKDVENNPAIMQAILDEAIQKVPEIEEQKEFREWTEKYGEQKETAAVEMSEEVNEEINVEAEE